VEAVDVCGTIEVGAPDAHRFWTKLAKSGFMLTAIAAAAAMAAWALTVAALDETVLVAAEWLDTTEVAAPCCGGPTIVRLFTDETEVWEVADKGMVPPAALTPPRDWGKAAAAACRENWPGGIISNGNMAPPAENAGNMDILGTRGA